MEQTVEKLSKEKLQGSLLECIKGERLPFKWRSIFKNYVTHYISNMLHFCVERQVQLF